MIRPLWPINWEAGPAGIRCKLAEILERWKGTPFMAGQCCRGVGVDCSHFVCAVLDELYGRDPRPVRRWKPGTGRQSLKAGAMVLRALKAQFPQARRHCGTVQPGDVLVIRFGRGPSHTAVVAPTPNEMWHVLNANSDCGPVPLNVYAFKIVRALRMSDRGRWIDG